MAKTRAMTRRSLSRKRSYRRRVRASSCRGKSREQCNDMVNCKFTSGQKRKFCRKSRNNMSRRRSGGKKYKTGGKRHRRTPRALLTLAAEGAQLHKHKRRSHTVDKNKARNSRRGLLALMTQAEKDGVKHQRRYNKTHKRRHKKKGGNTGWIVPWTLLGVNHLYKNRRNSSLFDKKRRR